MNNELLRKLEIEKGSMKEVEAGSGDLRGHTRCCLSMQGWR